MTDNILSALLTFSLLAGGTAAIGSEMFNTRAGDKVAATILMPEVTVVAKRAVALETVTLPEVTITGRRDTVVAADTDASEPRRVQ
jgi:hypothetical protein